MADMAHLLSKNLLVGYGSNGSVCLASSKLLVQTLVTHTHTNSDVSPISQVVCVTDTLAGRPISNCYAFKSPHTNTC
jgi:hypothetical protein